MRDYITRENKKRVEQEVLRQKFTSILFSKPHTSSLTNFNFIFYYSPYLLSPEPNIVLCVCVCSWTGLLTSLTFRFLFISYLHQLPPRVANLQAILPAMLGEQGIVLSFWSSEGALP